jgi:hypothetical protein
MKTKTKTKAKKDKDKDKDTTQKQLKILASLSKSYPCSERASMTGIDKTKDRGNSIQYQS